MAEPSPSSYDETRDDVSREVGNKVEKYIEKKNKRVVATDVAAAASGETAMSFVSQWFFQTVFSSINLGSHLSAISNRCISTDPNVPTDPNVGCVSYDRTTADKWTASSQSITLVLALLMVLFHYLCCKYLTKFVLGKLPEGIVAFVVLGFVAAGIPAIMDPDNEQAIGQDGSIINANLYFFTWASLCVAVYVCCNWLLSTCAKRGRNISKTMQNNSEWYFLLAASVVVTSSSSRLFTSTECSNGESSSYCSRLKYAIAAGSIGTFFALTATVLCLMNRLHTGIGAYVQDVMAFLVFIVFIMGIVFITFGGDDAPADNVGNLYFSTWIAFVFSMIIAFRSFHDFKNRFVGDEENPTDDDNKAEGSFCDVIMKEEPVEAENEEKSEPDETD